jgi:hypothetical protein
MFIEMKEILAFIIWGGTVFWSYQSPMEVTIFEVKECWEEDC